MNILIVSPLFPPDTAPAAVYTKELTIRLAYEHTVQVLHYGSLPELVTNVHFVSISKQTSVIFRTIQLTTKLIQMARKDDLVLLHNGPSVELPALIASVFFKRKIVLLISDKPAHDRTQVSRFKKGVHELLVRRSRTSIKEIDHDLFQKPTIHPLLPFPKEAIATYKQNWGTHLQLYHNLNA